jgi:hypothetical protein
MMETLSHKQLASASYLWDSTLDSTEVSREIQTILASIEDQYFPRAASAKIQTVLRRASPWAHAKTVGVSFVPNGDPTIACNNLFKAFNAKGLFVVPVGELEGFVRSNGGHGPKWVNDVLNKDLESDTEFDEAKEFIRQVLC